MHKQLPRLCVSENGRFLSTIHGTPFFWLGDTAWELFHRLTREEAIYYFRNRQTKRFNVIQAVILAELDGLNTPNRYGERPFHHNNPFQPNEAYFAYVDELLHLAAEHDLYVALLPTWGDKVFPAWGIGPAVFDAVNAEAYGRFLGQRYQSFSNIIWVIGGDRPAVTDEVDYRPIWRAMATGIREFCGNDALMTFHPAGRQQSSQWLHNEAWLDVNMMQSGHGGGRDLPVWEMIAHDFALHPAKPTLDGEPNYEDHPVNRWPSWQPENGYFRDWDVRKQAYRSVFAGGCGVTYGHHFVWQMWDEGHEPQNNGEELFSWQAALDRPGAGQMQHLRVLMESRPFFSRIPDQTLLVNPPQNSDDFLQTTRDVDGSYAFIYIPNSQPITVNLNPLAGDTIAVAWFDPRTGNRSSIGTFDISTTHTFTPPPDGPDWVLICDAVG